MEPLMIFLREFILIFFQPAWAFLYDSYSNETNTFCINKDLIFQFHIHARIFNICESANATPQLFSIVYKMKQSQSRA